MLLLVGCTGVSLFEVGVLLGATSAFTSTFFGARQVGISQTMPVKLLIRNTLFSHLRQGLPLRSSARRPALIAPWLALGPSLCPATGAGVVQGRVVPSWAVVPSLEASGVSNDEGERGGRCRALTASVASWAPVWRVAS